MPNGPPRYEFTADDLELLDTVHALISSFPKRFAGAGARLDERYSVERVLDRHGPPIPEEQRKAMLDPVLSGEEPNRREVEQLAAKLGNFDAARELVIRAEVAALSLPSPEDWSSPGRRFGEAMRDLFEFELSVETPSPSWDWASHVLLMAWLATEPRADTFNPMLTRFQEWKWDGWEPREQAHPDEVLGFELGRSIAAFGISQWPLILNGIRRAVRTAKREGLQSAPPAVMTTTEERFSTEARILALIFQHPEKTATDIAAMAGVVRQSLYKYPRVKLALRARAARKDDFPRAGPRTREQRGDIADSEETDEATLDEGQ